MEATVVSVAKSVLDGALSKAQSAVADEVALQLGVQRDLAFIKDEFDMMQTFLMAADEDRAKKKVVKTWVRQVRDLAYDAEDCLQDFSVHLQKPSWWRFPRTLRTRHRIAKEIKELKARVDDVSQRNLRYRLIEDSNPTTATERYSITSADEPWIAAANKDEPKVDLCQLITADDQALRVISVCGRASDDLKKMSIIMKVYDSQEIYTKFGCHAWIKLMNPVNPNDFFQSLVRQFYLNSLRAKGKAEEGAAIGVDVLKKMETFTTLIALIDEFHRHVNNNRYLIVIDDLSTVMEWDWIKTCFPDRKNGSRIIVSTEQVEIGRLCTGQPNLVSKLNQLSTDQPFYVFYNKPESSSNNATAANSIQPVVTDDIVEDQSTSMGGTSSPVLSLAKDSNSATGKSLARNTTMQAALEESQLVGREAARSDVIKLILQESEHCQVISVWGMGGIGKTTLVRSVYGSEELSGKFQKRAWVTVLHPFNPEEFFRSLALRLHTDTSDNDNTGKSIRPMGDDVQKKLQVMQIEDYRKRLQGMQIADLIKETSQLLERLTYLIVLDDLSSNTEWNSIMPHLPKDERASRIIITTREASVATRCSMNYKLNSLGDDEAHDLFKKKPESSIQRVATDHSTGIGGTSLAKGSNSAIGKSLARNMSTTQAALEESQLVGREAAIPEVIDLIRQERESCQVISVWGMGGIGKTTLVRSVYGSEELSGKFQKRAWVTVLHPFNPEEFFRSLALRLRTDTSDDDNIEKSIRPMGDDVQKKLQVMRKRLQGMQIADLRKETSQLLGRDTYLIVLDDLSSNTEWDSIIPHLPKSEKASRIIITTRDKSVASRCSMDYELKSLEVHAALDLFKKKVFSGTEKDNLTEKPLMEQAELILKKCGGLPLAIATIGGFLATKPKTTLEWRKLNDHISVELENNPELGEIKTVLTSSYDGLPYHLKSCFLYLSIFPEGHNIRHGRLVRRWIAEGYSREVRSHTAEEVAEEHFTDIINRSMIQPSKTGTDNAWKTTDFFQVHDLMREISISKSEEENLVFVLDEHSTLQPKNKVRHLVVSRSWSRDQKKDVLGSILDVSHIRSLTVFGKWRSFFISKRMRLLRVLDLEDVEDLQDHDLAPIGDLRHLKYLSLRNANRPFGYIYHLPDSFGNLLDLETLDIRGTFVMTLPASIFKLSKLKYLLAGIVPFDERHSRERRKNFQPLKKFGLAAYKSYLRRKSIADLDALPYLCFRAGVWYGGWDVHGVKVPRGIGRLKALHTLGVVNIARGEAMLKELKKLTQLRKLGVTGINKKNCKELCSAIANHDRLRTLSMRAEGKPGLQGCLDDLPPPPNDLHSLKLYGYLVKLPTWIEQIQMLAKLTLRSTELEHDALVVLGKLQNLADLRLRYGSFQGGELRFHFRSDIFRSLTVLELDRLYRVKSVAFEEKATPKLELLRVHYCLYSLGDGFSGIEFLSSLKEVSLKFPHYRYFDVCPFEEKMENLLVDERMHKIMEGRRTIREGLRKQLDKNKNKPHLNIED